MSTRVGTLRAPRAGGSILLAAFLASIIMLTIAVVAISVDRDAGRQGETTFIGGAAANTPTELSGGIRHKFVSDTLGTTTPSELSGGIGNGRPAETYDRHQRG